MEITCGFTGESFDGVIIQTKGGKKNLTLKDCSAKREAVTWNNQKLPDWWAR